MLLFLHLWYVFFITSGRAEEDRIKMERIKERGVMMGNPWEEIDLDDYEKHMGLDSVFQLQTMNQMMKEQFYAYPVQSVMILGIAGGNGLEHINKQTFEKV